MEITSLHQQRKIKMKKTPPTPTKNKTKQPKQLMNTRNTFQIPQSIVRLKTKAAWLTSYWLPFKTG